MVMSWHEVVAVIVAHVAETPAQEKHLLQTARIE